MRRRRLSLLVACAVSLLPLAASADVVSINFSGGRGGEPDGFPLLPADVAGNPNVPESFTSNWNNAPGTTGSNLALVNNYNESTTLLLSYSTALGTWSLANTTAGANLSGGANPQMMRGYLDASGLGSGSTVTITGLAGYFTSYQVAIFFDGDNGTAWRVATFTITDNADNAVLFTDGGEDSEGVNFNAGGGTTGNENPDGRFQFPVSGGAGNVMWSDATYNSGNNDEGNFLLSGSLSADSITILAEGTAGAGTTRRAPINGIQIIGVPKDVELPTISLAATDAMAGEPADTGTVTVTRTGGLLTRPAQVFYTVTTGATAGSDYQPLPASVTIPIGQNSADIIITPIDDGEVESNEPINIALSPSSAYIIGSPSSADVALNDDDVPWTVTVTASDAAASEAAGNPGAFTITRAGGTNLLFPLTVNYTLGGTATNAIDYAYQPTTVVIPAGETNVTVPVSPFEEGANEGSETVILAIVSNFPQYSAGVPDSATVTIADSGPWSRWGQSLNLVFAGYTGTEVLNEFPVLVKLTPERVGNYAGFAAGGADLRFRSGDLSLPYEIENWDPAGTSNIWVRVPQIDSNTDFIEMLWNNPSVGDAQSPEAVWDGYLGAYHFADPDAIEDSTNNSNHAVNSGSTTSTSVAGQIGLGRGFNGTDALVDLGDPFLSNLNSFTLSGWINPTALGSRIGLWGQNDAIEFGFNGGSNLEGWTAGTGTAVSAPYTPPLGQWHHVVIVGDPDAKRLHIDGVLAATDATAAPTGYGASNFTVKLGAAIWDTTGNWYNGLMDEVRMAAAAQSGDWIINDFASTSDNLIAYTDVAQVQITATEPTATEGGGGTFLVTRSGGAVNLPLDIYFQVSGTATPHQDYVALPAPPVTLTAGQTQASIPVAVLTDGLPLEGDETVIVTLVDRADYDISGLADATVTITDVDTIAGWQNSKKITFGGYEGTTTLTDFVAMIKLTPEKTANYAGFAAGGADVLFLNETQTAVVPHEIEQWDAAGDSIIWVKVPELASRLSHVWMLWNNPSATDHQNPGGVWSTNYSGVWHLNQPDPNTGRYPDSTGRTPGGENFGGTPFPGQIAGALSFDGASYVNSNNVDNLSPFTILCWARSPAPPDGDAPSGPLHREANYQFNWDHGDANFRSATALNAGGWNAADLDPTNTIAADTWYLLIGTYDGETLRSYRDGVFTAQNETPSGAPGAQSYPMTIARHATATGNFFTGAVDEVQLLSVAQSDDWILAQHLSMTDQLTIEVCGAPIFDADIDNDVDQDDFANLQACYTGDLGQHGGGKCRCADANNDGAVNQTDVAAFVLCVSGPDVPANPDCLPG